MKKEVIICRYKEDVSWIKSLTCEYIVYNKGEKISNINQVECPNSGREGETYLRHIINNYNNLADINIFLQGSPHEHHLGYLACLDENETGKYDSNIVNVINNYNDIDLLFCDGYITECDECGNPHHKGLPLRMIYNLLNIKKEFPSRIIFSAGAQFFVPKKMILNKSIDWWTNAYSVYNSHGISPWVFERLWQYIWRYDENFG